MYYTSKSRCRHLGNFCELLLNNSLTTRKANSTPLGDRMSRQLGQHKNTRASKPARKLNTETRLYATHWSSANKRTQ